MNKTKEYISFAMNAPVGFLLVDESSRVIQMNYFLVKKLGTKPRRHYYGKSIPEVFGNEISHVISWLVEQSRSAAEQSTQEVRYKNTDFLVSATPVVLSKKAVAVGLLFQDITNQKEAEKLLLQYKYRLDQAQETGNLGVFEWNLKNDTVWWSNEEEALFGVQPGKFKGTINDWIKAVYIKDRDYVKHILEKAKKERTKLDFEFRVVYPGGEIHWLKAKANFYKHQKSSTKIIGIHHDVTGRKDHEELLQFKAESSRILSSSLDYRITLPKIANLAVFHIADWCTVDIISPDSGVVFKTAAHRDPLMAKWVTRIREKYPAEKSEKTRLGKVIRTGKSVLVSTISEKEIESSVKNDEQRKILNRIGHVTSLMIVPVTSGNKTIGAISFLSTESRRHYTKQDLEIAEQLASRAAMSIENAKLFERLQDEQRHLDDLLENVPALIWEAWGDPLAETQRITYVSAYAEKLLGYPREMWLNTPNFWKKIVYPEDLATATKTAKRNFETKNQGISRFRWMKQNGEPVWVESQSFIIRDDHGNPLGMRGIVHDISEAMEEVSRKDEFLSMASHELKTPVTTIKAYTQLLQKTQLTPAQHLYVTKSLNQIEKMVKLISDLLDISRFNRGTLISKREVFSLGKVVSETVDSIKAFTKTHSINLIINGDGTVYADRDRITQVVSNLIVNAIKYSDVGKEIIVTVKREDPHIKVYVQDQGIGISERHLPKIFERFYRVKGRDKASGLGIGLFLSKNIIEKQRGTLTVESSLGKGSTFCMSLPLYIKS